ncbi:thioredoxin-disulfide reductase [Chloroflexota bacterium]
MDKKYEVVIIGGGPAGLSAGIYTARARLKSLLIEKGLIGGQIINAELVENYPGFPEGISGYDLTQLMYQQTAKFGLETVTTEVIGIELKDRQKVVKTREGDFITEAVIIAGGSEQQKLEVPGEIEFTGKGVSYCATCDAALFTEQPIAIAGGGNAAISEALQLSKFASKVTVIHRRQELRATRILQEKAFAQAKIKFLWNTVIEKIDGGKKVERIILRNILTEKKSALNIAGVFIAIGFKPNTDYLKGLVPLDNQGYIITNEKMETVIPGILAAGDTRSNSIRQVASSIGDGAVAAIYAEKFLTNNELQTSNQS